MSMLHSFCQYFSVVLGIQHVLPTTVTTLIVLGEENNFVKLLIPFISVH